MTSAKKTNPTVIVVALVYPTLLTLAYFDWFSSQSSSLQQFVFTSGKLIQFTFPIIWVWLICRQPVGVPRPSARGVGLGIGFGVVVLLAMMALYHMLLKPAGFFDAPREQVIAKVNDLGLNGFWKYAAAGVFYALFHSLLEEYYWRWFVFGQLRLTMSLGWAIGVSSLGFMAHHVVLLKTYFGWQSPATYFFSMSVAVGGMFWAWLYEHTKSIYAPWISHMLIDAAIFLIGYDLIRQVFQQ
jgi:membrane protease YdiL (CAAX protease family)